MLATRELVTAVLNCVLSVNLEVSPQNDMAVFDYQFTNRGAQPVVVFNLLHDDVDYRLRPELVNVEERYGEAFVSKKLVPVPDELDVEQVNIPCGTVVPPGQSLRERISVRLPLTVWTPYDVDRKPGAFVVKAPVTFELGFFPVTPEALQRLPRTDTPAGPAVCPEVFTEATQQILSVGPFDQMLPARF